MYEQILIPTDGSETATAALQEAIEIADAYDATLHALHVTDTTAIPTNLDAESALRALDEAGRETLDAAMEQAKMAGVKSVQAKVARGPPYRAILDYVDDHDVDLIVMGTHGRTGLDRYLIGSVTEKVVRLSDVPVLTIRPPRAEGG